MLIAVLGPLEVSEVDPPVSITGQRLRTLLARLAVDASRVVSSTELIDAIWGDDPPAEATNALQTLVSRLRRAIGDAAQLQQVGAGYQLSGADVDVERFSGLVDRAHAAARAHDSAVASDLFGQALALWRGEPLADAAGADWAATCLARVSELRIQAVLGRAEALLALGSTDVAVSELETATLAHPWNEPLAVLLMRALAEAGRIPEALSRFERLRQSLAEELGTDPGVVARELHVQLLRGEPAAEETRQSRRTNLRVARTSFLGREAEIERLGALLESGRLATIVGPGGAGKSRLAGEVASSWVPRMEDGVWFVELAPVTDEVNLPQAILGSLGLRGNQVLDNSTDITRQGTFERLLDVLADAQCLLVVDNCEHLITAVAALLDVVLGQCPGVRVLTTSREPLGIDGEALCVLPPLSMPPADANPLQALEYSSVLLFCDRARAVVADFDLEADTVAAVIEIVRRLDGLPLAIELATARLRVLPVTEIASRLTDRFRLLTGGSRVAMPRHRTLRAVVEWSWELLSPAERLLAERLAVFPSGATLDSAVAVCADDRLDGNEIGDLLDTLVDKSLLHVDSVDGVRYRMLETLREYGIERLDERHELEEVRLAHARHYGALPVEAEHWLRTREQLVWIRRLDVERDNVLAALRYLGTAGLAQEAVDVVNSLGWYWILTGNHGDGLTWMRFALEVDGEVTHRSRVMCEALNALNTVATMFGDDTEATERGISEIKRVRREMDQISPQEEPMVVLMRPLLAFFDGDNVEMEELLTETLAAEDTWMRATGRMFRANMRDNEGDVEGMRVDAEASYELFNEVGDRWGIGTTLQTLAQLKSIDGDVHGAIADYSRAVDLAHEIGSVDDEVMLHVRLIELYLRTGDITAARREADLARRPEANTARPLRLMAELGAAAIARETNDEIACRAFRRSLSSLLEFETSMHPMSGHVHSMGLAALAGLMLVTGDGNEARETLLRAYAMVLDTKDMPLIARVGAVVGELAVAHGQFADAAEILGACARIRGADDPTDRVVSSVRGHAVSGLGSQEKFDESYRFGRDLDRDDALQRLNPALIEAGSPLARLSDSRR